VEARAGEEQPISQQSYRVEQDPRAIKRRCGSMAGFSSLGSAAITLTGIELAYRIRKRQFCFGPGRQRRHASLKELWDRALA
jgi:transposase-like protein